MFPLCSRLIFRRRRRLRWDAIKTAHFVLCIGVREVDRAIGDSAGRDGVPVSQIGGRLDGVSESVGTAHAHMERTVTQTAGEAADTADGKQGVDGAPVSAH